MKSVREYREALYGCRFCSMCKPAAEVANLTQFESHTTRARAITLWRVQEGIAEWRPRDVELLYESTLDSISQAWCVVDYPVSEYVLAARAAVYAAGLAPPQVRDAVRRAAAVPPAEAASVLLLGGEAAEAGIPELAQDAVRALGRVGTPAKAAVAPSGALAYCLGDLETARAQAEAVAGLIRDAGARSVVADGPQTLWALTRILPDLGVQLPHGVGVHSLSECLAGTLQSGSPTRSRSAGARVLFHDSRAASLLAEAPPTAEAIQPGYHGPEETLGKGRIFDAPRQGLDALGMQRLFSVWSRALCKSCGADDGLWLTYPALAEGLARQRLREAKRQGAELLVADSPLCVTHLSRFAAGEGVEVCWLAALLEG
jgi:Fe-S oxidoreductase